MLNTAYRKVVILADRHGKGIVDKLRRKLPSDCNVMSCVSPDAPLHYFIKNYECTLSMLTKDDHVLVVAGSNDFDAESNDDTVRSFLSSLLELSDKCRNTNLTLATIPYRYDVQELTVVNKLIKIANRALRTFCKEWSSDIDFIDLWTIGRNWHTRHGLSLNNKGKLGLSEMFADCCKKRQKRRDKRSQDTHSESSIPNMEVLETTATSMNFDESNNLESMTVADNTDLEEIEQRKETLERRKNKLMKNNSSFLELSSSNSHIVLN
jgi:hypothetical protein